MKVLLLHQHFNQPAKGGAIRSYYLAKALVDKGIETIVITAHNEKIYKKQILEGIEIHYLPVAYDNKFGFAARSFSFLKYNLGAIRVANKIKHIDYCYAISVPLTIGLVAMWLKTFRKIPYLFEVGDLWPDAPIQLGFVENYFFKEFLFSLEKRTYRSAKAVVALSPSIEAIVKKKMGLPASVHQIPNMADCEYYQPETKRTVLEEKFKVKGKFVVSYIGAVGVANGLDYFLECANASRKAQLPIQFIICGEGALRERLKNNAAQLGLSNLTFVDFQNREGVKELLNVTDASFICYKNVPILETGSPNKFFDGLAAGKMIIVNFGGWIKNEIELVHCGVFVDPAHPTDFVKKISPFLSNPVQLKNYQAAARQLGETKYARKILSEKFSSLFK
ncbi:MAG: glycosyltransferase family 4 protein [Cyclobacteriaceae bacterium]|nr:glycosyltransferase family 4 protein [Cyclobacteriaceae bacterium]